MAFSWQPGPPLPETQHLFNGASLPSVLYSQLGEDLSMSET
jgi:hypothetical protein